MYSRCLDNSGILFYIQKAIQKKNKQVEYYLKATLLIVPDVTPTG